MANTKSFYLPSDVLEAIAAAGNGSAYITALVRHDVHRHRELALQADADHTDADREAARQWAREQLASVARIVLGAWQADPDLVRVLVREIARSPQLGNEVDEVEHAFAALERIVARGQQRGELRADVDPRLAAWILYGALEEILTGWVFDRLPAGPEDVARAEQTVVSVLADGLAVD